MKRLLSATTMVALIAVLMAPTAQAQAYWYWCWNGSHGYWDYCWWDGGVIQESDQDSEAGEITQTFSIS